MKSIRWFYLLFLLYACSYTDTPTIIEGRVVGQDTGLPKSDISVKVFGIKEKFMGSSYYVSEHNLTLDAEGRFSLSFSHPEVNYFTILLVKNSSSEILDPVTVNCSPYACLDLPSGKRYELEIRVVE
jgi:hypothetical protein